MIVLCGSIPTYKPLWDRFVKPKLHTRASSGSYTPKLGISSASQKHTSPNESICQGLGYGSEELRFAPVGAANTAEGHFAAITHFPRNHPIHGSSEILSEDPLGTRNPTTSDVDLNGGIQVTETVRVEWTQHANESSRRDQLV